MDENLNQLDVTLSQIVRNELILNNIFVHLDEISIEQCLAVCRRWNHIAKSVDRPKRKIFQIISVFLLDRFKSRYEMVSSKYNFLQSPLIAKSIDNLYSKTGARGPEIFEFEFLNTLKESYPRPKCLLLLEGDNIKVGKNRRWKRAKVINTIRSSLPHDCSVIGIDAHYGIIGESSDTALTDSKDYVAVSWNASGLFGISCLVLPKYDGVTITIFERATEDLEEDFIISNDAKAVILFSSGVSCSGGYLYHSRVDAIFDHFGGKLALGGAQVNDKLVSSLHTVQYFSDDTANFYFVNGPPPYNAMFNPKKMSLIGIQFNGPNCEAASLFIEQLDPNHYDQVDKELAHIEAKLMAFRSKLTFPCDSRDPSDESIAFLFFNFACYHRYALYTDDLHAGVSLFYKIFPKTHITGILCHAQYEHDYVPLKPDSDTIQMQDQMKSRSPSLVNSFQSKPESSTGLLPSPRGIASFVIINIKK